MLNPTDQEQQLVNHIQKSPNDNNKNTKRTKIGLIL